MKKIIGIVEKVALKKPDGTLLTVMAKIDTGAHGCSISQELRAKIIPPTATPLKYKLYASALGRQRRPVYRLIIVIKGERVETEVTISQRTHLMVPVLIGVRALQKFLVDPSLPHAILHKKTKPCDDEPS